MPSRFSGGNERTWRLLVDTKEREFYAKYAMLTLFHPMKRLSAIPLLLPVLMLLAAVHPARAVTDQYAGAKWAFLDQAQTMAAANQITLAKYPDSDEATVEEKLVEAYQPDGTAGEQDEAYVKVLTEKGKRDRRTLSLGFLLPYFNVNVVKLEVIKPDGQAVPVDVAANSTVTIDDSQMEENIYDPNSKVLQVNIPEVEIGDVVHYIVRTTVQRSIIPGEFADENEFEGEGFIRHSVYEVYAPLDKPLKKVVLKSEIAGTGKYTTFPGTPGRRWCTGGNSPTCRGCSTSPRCRLTKTSSSGCS